MRKDQVAEIAWSLRAIGRLNSDMKNDGGGSIYRVWIDGGHHVDGSEVIATGETMSEAVRALWKQLTEPGSYVMIGSRKHVYGSGVWQIVLE